MKKLLKPVDMREGREWKVILLFSLPIVISYLLQQVYIVSDAAICGQTLSADEVAGVNDVSPLIYIFLEFAFGCTAGFGVITSERVGGGDYTGVRRSFAAQIILSAAITVVLTAVSLLCIDPMLRWINVTPANAGVYRAAYGYCFVIFLGIFAQMFYNFICTILRSVGDSVTPLVFLLISTILNVGLDLLFITAFGWGVIGAAAATVSAQVLSTVACFVYTFARYKELRLKRGDFKINLKELRVHIAQGIPLGLQFSVMEIGVIVMRGQMILFDLTPEGVMAVGNPAQNGYGAANRLGNLLMSPFDALGTGIVSFIAQNLGACEYDRVRRGVIHSTIMSLILYVLLAGIGLLLTINGAFMYLFLSVDKVTESAIKFGNLYLYVALSFYFLLGILFVWRSAVQALGKSAFTLLAGAAELTARVLVCLFLPAAVNGGAITTEASAAAYIALCFADPIAWLGAVAALAYPIIRYAILKKYKKVHKKS